MTRIPEWMCAIGLVCAAGCGGTPEGPTARIAVGGAYDIRKTIVSDSCGLSMPGDVITNPAEVRHTAGASNFVLNDHGTRDLPGTVAAGGSFTLAQQRATVMGTIAALDTWDNGRFTTTGFEVRNTTDLDSKPGGGPACRVVATWAATKQGAANVIP